MLGFALAACGSDGGGHAIDAAPAMDVSTIDVRLGPDATPNPPAVGLGQVCSASMTCPDHTPAFDCESIDTNPSDGFCTVTCGTTPDPGTGTPMRPDGGDAICAANYTGPGVARCDIYGAPDPTGNVTWSCALECSTDADCPGGLTCPNIGLCQK